MERVCVCACVWRPVCNEEAGKGGEKRRRKKNELEEKTSRAVGAPMLKRVLFDCVGTNFALRGGVAGGTLVEARMCSRRVYMCVCASLLLLLFDSVRLPPFLLVCVDARAGCAGASTPFCVCLCVLDVFDRGLLAATSCGVCVKQKGSSGWVRMQFPAVTNK